MLLWDYETDSVISPYVMQKLLTVNERSISWSIEFYIENNACILFGNVQCKSFCFIYYVCVLLCYILQRKLRRNNCVLQSICSNLSFYCLNPLLHLPYMQYITAIYEWFI